MTETKQAGIKVDSSVLELASRVATAVDITDVRMINMHASLLQWDGKTPTLSRMGHSARTTRSKSGESIEVQVALFFDMAEDTETSRDKPPLSIHATFSLRYQVRDLNRYSDEEVEAFGTVNGAYNAWPFWRELVYTTLSRMGVPPIALPVFRVLPKVDSGAE